MMAKRVVSLGSDETQFPAFAVIGLKTRACMMGEPIGSFENKEFLKIPIKFDKLTGFFDKFIKC